MAQRARTIEVQDGGRRENSAETEQGNHAFTERKSEFLSVR